MKVSSRYLFSCIWAWISVKCCMVGWESKVLAMAWTALLCHLVHKLIICLLVQHETTWCKQLSIWLRQRWAKMVAISILYGWLSCDGGWQIMSLVRMRMILRLSWYMCTCRIGVIWWLYRSLTHHDMYVVQVFDQSTKNLLQLDEKHKV